MGQIKQLHIDCTVGECLVAGFEDTCYKQPDLQDLEPTEPSEDTEGSDRDPQFDMDRE